MRTRYTFYRKERTGPGRFGRVAGWFLRSRYETPSLPLAHLDRLA